MTRDLYDLAPNQEDGGKSVSASRRWKSGSRIKRRLHPSWTSVKLYTKRSWKQSVHNYGLPSIHAVDHKLSTPSWVRWTIVLVLMHGLWYGLGRSLTLIYMWPKLLKSKQHSRGIFSQHSEKRSHTKSARVGNMPWRRSLDIIRIIWTTLLSDAGSMPILSCVYWFTLPLGLRTARSEFFRAGFTKYQDSDGQEASNRNQM